METRFIFQAYSLYLKKRETAQAKEMILAIIMSDLGLMIGTLFLNFPMLPSNEYIQTPNPYVGIVCVCAIFLRKYEEIAFSLSKLKAVLATIAGGVFQPYA